MRSIRTVRSRRLRRRSTDAESHLWYHLRDRRLAGFKFRRQHPIDRYFADFACVERNLVVELDGAQHCQSQYDVLRDAMMQRLGWRVVRYSDRDVLLNTTGVLEALLAELQVVAPSP
jgi:very-short-patch-repair endonuclease